MRRNLVLWFVLLLTGFLTGFILQYARLQRVLQELSASEIVRSTDDPVLRDLLHDILATRDPTTADLAKGDAIAVSGIQQSYPSSSRLQNID